MLLGKDDFTLLLGDVLPDYGVHVLALFVIPGVLLVASLIFGDVELGLLAYAGFVGVGANNDILPINLL